VGGDGAIWGFGWQSTVQNADRLVVIRQGSIAEDGTHANLIEQKGVYWHLVRREQVFET
jgi:ABC-type multidrug transport system fused ATPase/permease subunit